MLINPIINKENIAAISLLVPFGASLYSRSGYSSPSSFFVYVNVISVHPSLLFLCFIIFIIFTMIALYNRLCSVFL